MSHGCLLKSSAGRHNPSRASRPAAVFPSFYLRWSQGFRLQPSCKDPGGHEQMAMSEWRPERSLPGTAWHHVQHFLKTGKRPPGHPSSSWTLYRICHRGNSCSILPYEASVHCLWIRSHQKPDMLHAAFAQRKQTLSFQNRHLGRLSAAKASCFAFGGLEWYGGWDLVHGCFAL